MEDVRKFFGDILSEISLRDSLHYKTLIDTTPVVGSYEPFYNYLSSLVYFNFQTLEVDPAKAVTDYLRMVNDMRKESVYFDEFGTYSCKSEKDAYERFYSHEDVMPYYLNALMLSQVLWKHHYDILKFFDRGLAQFFNKTDNISVLDVGAGHGLYSSIVMDDFSDYRKVDILDVSKASLGVTEELLGNDRIEYHTTLPNRKYDLIIMGEVIEHMDYPALALTDMYGALADGGVIWVSTPTNAPAIDHIHLFKTTDEVVKLLNECDFHVVSSFVTPAYRTKTEIIGTFCVKK